MVVWQSVSLSTQDSEGQLSENKVLRYVRLPPRISISRELQVKQEFSQQLSISISSSSDLFPLCEPLLRFSRKIILSPSSSSSRRLRDPDPDPDLDLLDSPQ
jgi:hypothetical protein